MPSITCKRKPIVFRSLFPDWSGPRPFHFFMMENLLEARSRSFFPTNGAGPDEDVNVYLAHLLTEFLTGNIDSRLVPGSQPRLQAPGKTVPRRLKADWYRINGDHRLLCQGLFDRGDALRRCNIFLGTDKGETRSQDRVTGLACYSQAASLLENRQVAPAGLVEVLRKLEKHYDQYIHVLAVLATRCLGLGARLSDSELTGLIGNPAPVSENQNAEEIISGIIDRPEASMDHLLDLLLEYQKHADPSVRRNLVSMAEQIGVDPEALLRAG